MCKTICDDCKDTIHCIYGDGDVFPSRTVTLDDIVIECDGLNLPWWIIE